MAFQAPLPTSSFRV